MSPARRRERGRLRDPLNDGGTGGTRRLGWRRRKLHEAQKPPPSHRPPGTCKGRRPRRRDNRPGRRSNRYTRRGRSPRAAGPPPAASGPAGARSGRRHAGGTPPAAARTEPMTVAARTRDEGGRRETVEAAGNERPEQWPVWKLPAWAGRALRGCGGAAPASAHSRASTVEAREWSDVHGNVPAAPAERSRETTRLVGFTVRVKVGGWAPCRIRDIAAVSHGGRSRIPYTQTPGAAGRCSEVSTSRDRSRASQWRSRSAKPTFRGLAPRKTPDGFHDRRVHGSSGPDSGTWTSGSDRRSTSAHESARQLKRRCSVIGASTTFYRAAMGGCASRHSRAAARHSG